jgi:hypothetical protein
MDTLHRAELYIADQEIPSEDKLWKVEELLRQFSNNPVWHTIQCQSGWIDTIYQLHEALLIVYPEYRIVQIKQKFGTLRFYIDQYPKYNTAQHLIVAACVQYGERKSQRICERCGAEHYSDNVELRTMYGWHHTYCDKCELAYVQMMHDSNNYISSESLEYKNILEDRIVRTKERNTDLSI